MIFAIAAVLVILWAAGVVTSYTMTGIFQVLLVIAIAIALLRLVGIRRARS
jgi:hypothetical protein